MLQSNIYISRTF